MRRTIVFVFTMCAAFLVGSCGGTMAPANNAGNANANANTNSSKPVAAAPTKEALFALENKAFEAWSKKDGKFFEGFLTDNFVMFTPGGRADKAAAIKEISESKCEVKSQSLSDEQMTPIGSDVVVLTAKATADYTCDGKKGPSPVWSSSIYVRSGDAWKAAYHNENPIPDPNAKAEAPKPPPPPAKAAAEEAKPDALTETLLAIEKKNWEAWKAGDAKPLEENLSKDFLYVSAQGRMNKAETIKAWAESKCDVKSYSLTDGKSVSLNATTALLTFRGNASGTCDGQPIHDLWGTTLFVKEGDIWKPVFYTDSM